MMFEQRLPHPVADSPESVTHSAVRYGLSIMGSRWPTVTSRTPFCTSEDRTSITMYVLLYVTDYLRHLNPMPLFGM